MELTKAISADDKTKAMKLTHALIGSATQVGAREIVSHCRHVDDWCAGTADSLDSNIELKLLESFRLTIESLNIESELLNLN